MRVVLRRRGGGGGGGCGRGVSEVDEREIDVTGVGPRTTLREVLIAAGVPSTDAGSVRVDGATVDADRTPDTAGVLHGSIIDIGPSREDLPAAQHPGGFEVAVVGGLDSGARCALPGGGAAVTIGRAAGVDLCIGDATVSPRHAAIRLSAVSDGFFVDDLGSHNGTAVMGQRIGRAAHLAPGTLIELGASQLVVRRRRGESASTATRHGAAGRRRPWTVPFNRPPRRAPDGPADEVPVPDPPSAGRGHAAFSLVALVGPIAMGLVMVQVLGSLRYALFALMSPLLMIGNHLAGRRRSSREQKRSTRRFRDALAGFEEALDAAASHERVRRQRQAPDLAEVLRRATTASTHVWERRPSHHDHLVLRVGRGPVPWRPPVDHRRTQAHPDIAAAAARASVIPDCPVHVQLSAGGVVGVVGDRRASMAVARSLIVQACVHHGPADVRLAVFTSRDRAVDWQWLAWMPHTAGVVGDDAALSDDSRVSVHLLEELLAADSSPERTLMVVFDDDDVVASSSARAVLRGEAGPVAGLVVAAAAHRLPAVSSAVVELAGDLGAAVVHRPAAGEVVGDVVVSGLSEANARLAARSLARLDDLEADPPGGGLPDLVTLPEMLGAVDPAAVAQR